MLQDPDSELDRDY